MSIAVVKRHLQSTPLPGPPKPRITRRRSRPTPTWWRENRAIVLMRSLSAIWRVVRMAMVVLVAGVADHETLLVPPQHFAKLVTACAFNERDSQRGRWCAAGRCLGSREGRRVRHHILL
jgi:hypothetical protein